MTAQERARKLVNDWVDDLLPRIDAVQMRALVERITLELLAAHTEVGKCRLK